MSTIFVHKYRTRMALTNWLAPKERRLGSIDRLRIRTSGAAGLGPDKVLVVGPAGHVGGDFFPGLRRKIMAIQADVDRLAERRRILLKQKGFQCRQEKTAISILKRGRVRSLCRRDQSQKNLRSTLLRPAKRCTKSRLRTDGRQSECPRRSLLSWRPPSWRTPQEPGRLLARRGPHRKPAP
jgi:hypothetical protein